MLFQKKRWNEENITVILKLKPEIYWVTFLIEGLNYQILIKLVSSSIFCHILLQNFNPINLERKLDVEKERDMVKYLWDDCIPHDFVRYMYKQENYGMISKPNLT